MLAGWPVHPRQKHHRDGSHWDRPGRAEPEQPVRPGKRAPAGDPQGFSLSIRPPSWGRAAAWLLAKETRDSALAFNQDVRLLPAQAPRIWTSAPACVYATTPARPLPGGPTGSRSPSRDQSSVRWWAAWAPRRVPTPTPDGCVRAP